MEIVIREMPNYLINFGKKMYGRKLNNVYTVCTHLSFSVPIKLITLIFVRRKFVW